MTSKHHSEVQPIAVRRVKQKEEVITNPTSKTQKPLRYILNLSQTTIGVLLNDPKTDHNVIYISSSDLIDCRNVVTREDRYL